MGQEKLHSGHCNTLQKDRDCFVVVVFGAVVEGEHVGGACTSIVPLTYESTSAKGDAAVG